MRLLGLPEGNRATTCMGWASIVALGHVADPTGGAYITTEGVATYAPPVGLMPFSSPQRVLRARVSGGSGLVSA
ncbi:hypothetical protein SBA2_360004 [Acidobacteriia bacterium SbA2]|nr:hypothetical protein SBA2_360004 [Acidobacteriia bacterium SbA2]